jgi:hypothetical protein
MILDSIGEDTVQIEDDSVEIQSLRGCLESPPVVILSAAKNLAVLGYL